MSRLFWASWVWCFLGLLMCAGSLTSTAVALEGQERSVQSFVIRDEIGQDWQNDLVTFSLDESILEQDLPNLTLLAPDGSHQPVQFHGEGNARKITFLATVPTYETSTYQLVRRASPPLPNPFVIERHDDVLRVSNGITGIELPTSRGAYKEGPIQRIRLMSGAWIGGSRLVDVPAISNYEANITAQGPVFVQVSTRYQFADGKAWMLTMRLIAGEPVVLIREQCMIEGGARWEFVANKGWPANRVFMRPGTGQPEYKVWPITFNDSIVAKLCPWIQWWDERQGLVYGLFEDGGSDNMLIAGAGDVAAWGRSGPEIYDSVPQRLVPLHGEANGDLVMHLSLIEPGRSWMLAAGSVAKSQVADNAVAPSHKLMNRYCETPLNTLKDMPLHWERSKREFPRLMVNRNELLAWLRSTDYPALLTTSKKPALKVKQLLWSLIANNDAPPQPAAVAAFKQQLLKQFDHTLEMFRYGNRGYPAAMYGTLIPRIDMPQWLSQLDLALGANVFTQEEEDRIFAQLAFLATKLASPDYVSPGRSLAGNPNMVTAWSASLVLLAAMMPDHPQASAWYREGMGRLDHMLTTWQGPNGGWLEAPHYQVAALDPLLFVKRAAANAGLGDDVRNEHLLRTTMFLAKISTPPDPRFDNLRHFPPLGNTYRKETSMLFGVMAGLHAEQNPQAAEALQWLWQQQGAPFWSYLGGVSYMDFYVPEVLRPDWTVPAPEWGSELFPGFGAVLRSGFPGDRETYMVYHQGDAATAHYDQDQGSFEFWGKGRPLCLDWGFRGHMAASLHNRMSIGHVGKVQQFAHQPTADYVRGRQDTWDRQILFVKDNDPLGPNYVVLCDTTSGGGEAGWHLWVNAKMPEDLPKIPDSGVYTGSLDREKLPSSIRIAGDTVSFTGEHDVDLDVWFAPIQRGKPIDAVHFEHAAVVSVAGYVGGGWSGWNDDRLDQYGIQLTQPGGKPLASVLYPRLRDEAAAQFRTMADGKVTEVKGPWGTDYVFLNAEPFEFQEGPIRFKGTAGVIQRRGDKVTLTLAAQGEISYGRVALQSDEPAVKADAAP